MREKILNFDFPLWKKFLTKKRMLLGMKTALLISTYNWPEALNLVLKSVQAQTVMPDEILIADDGSREDTKQVIDSFRDKISSPIKHIWHEDEGFRRSRILNKAISETIADYIIQTDGDCLIHPRFVEDHILKAKPNTYLFGSRVNLLEEGVKELFEKEVTRFGVFSKLIKNRTRNIHCSVLANLYNPQKALSKKLRGCNMSYWKSDFIAVNGYDNSYEGWGREDSDLATRLTNSGLYSQRMRYTAIVYHIWHREASKERLGLNDEIFNKVIAEKNTRCESGINEYL